MALMLAALAAEGSLPAGRVALAPPTGRAAARLAEAVAEAAADLPLGHAARAALANLHGTTLHRLLGSRPDSRTRFRHGPEARLPHRLVVVDEASMVPLGLMARLLESLAEDAALVLVGDPHQLASVEAGAVLGDIVGPAAHDRDAAGPLAGRIAVLRRSHRFGGAIATLAEAVRAGDASAALAALASGDPAVTWVDAEATSPAGRRAVTGPARGWAAALIAAGRAGDGAAALGSLGEMRVLAAHRRGPYGAEGLGALCESLLAGAGAVPGHHYPGRPLIITANDPALGVHNGDAGVVVARGEEPPALALPDPAGGVRLLAPTRLPGTAPVHAMTIHRAQGSQFDHVVVVLPPPHSPVLTRELLYTALTRARRRLTLVGTRASVEAALARPVARSSGLSARLWHTTP
ncbi:MAG: exodeoxyribonuclease V subunit alpha [Miltoncostaeaceae bacterium]